MQKKVMRTKKVTQSPSKIRSNHCDFHDISKYISGWKITYSYPEYIRTAFARSNVSFRICYFQMLWDDYLSHLSLTATAKQFSGSRVSVKEKVNLRRD
jgi:hypothetical protein